MLNYLWLALILIGIGVALYADIGDLSSNKYHNGEQTTVVISMHDPLFLSGSKSQQYSCTVQIDSIVQKAQFLAGENGSGVLHILLDDKTPSLWKEIFAAQKNNDFLLARVKWEGSIAASFNAKITFDPVTFVKMNAVTNDGIIKYAKTAVELAIGLIGIMALWLGLMKIADQSGLVAILAKALRPITTRIFPDVPADHPAMGAMIMNISANMLGLANAATPLGLKAMEELNKLNKKAGTATDAMCTFLVINTSNVQLIPATVIAIRAAAGSSNPTEILGPVIIATFITLIIGIVAVKLLARMKFYRKQLE